MLGLEEFLRFLRGVGPVCGIGERLLALVERGEDTADTVDQLVAELTNSILALRDAEEAVRDRRDRSAQAAEGRRTRWRVSRYAKTQELYRKNPSRLAELALQDQLGELLECRERVDPP